MCVKELEIDREMSINPGIVKQYTDRERKKRQLTEKTPRPSRKAVSQDINTARKRRILKTERKLMNKKNTELGLRLKGKRLASERATTGCLVTLLTKPCTVLSCR